MQTIKNQKGQIYDFQSYIDVDLKKDIIESMSKIMQVVHQKFIENTGIPRYRDLSIEEVKEDTESKEETAEIQNEEISDELENLNIE